MTFNNLKLPKVLQLLSNIKKISGEKNEHYCQINSCLNDLNYYRALRALIFCVKISNVKNDVHAKLTDSEYLQFLRWFKG